MNRWPRRSKHLPPDMPERLQVFREADWQVWRLDGPDPAAEVYKDRDSTRFYAGLLDRPKVAAAWRRRDAHERWSSVRQAWLEDHDQEALAFTLWLSDLNDRQQTLQAQLREAAPATR